MAKVFSFSGTQILQLLFPFAIGTLAQRLLLAIEHKKNIDEFHKEILNYFLPGRLQHSLFDQYFYRQQYSNETIWEYVEELKTIRAIFNAPLSDSQVIDAILSGAKDVEIRAQFLAVESICTFSQLDALCARSQALIREPLFTTQQPPFQQVRQQQKSNSCFLCNQVGHFVRDCPQKSTPIKSTTRSD